MSDLTDDAIVFDSPTRSPSALVAPFYFLPQFAPLGARIISLPDEVLALIFELVSRSDRVSLLRVCSNLHFLVARSIYATVHVRGKSSRIFFATIAYSSRFSTVYATMVRRLRYTVVYASEAFLTYPVFCQALNLMDGLYSLSLDVSPHHSENMVISFKRYGLIRERVLAATRLLRSSMGTAPPPATRALSRLRCLKIKGDPSVAALLVHREIEEVILINEVGYAFFSDFCCLVDRSIYGSRITILSIWFALELDTTAVLYALAEILPNLSQFTVEQRSSDALTMVRLLAAPTQLFPLLRKVSINRVCSRQRFMFDSALWQGVSKDLEDVPFSSRLWHVRIGTCRWVLDIPTNRWIFKISSDNS
ncbi:hypothetical protein DFH09DRAFT_1077473 [Mycena vulgaris]|nr:hypothetical protein DFH09DRAFT_1077473 [Mycena vulgaris]